jgi:PPOX class probable F420-dependent enzyme
MSKAECDAFLKETRIGTLCTLNEDGSPNALPIWYDWDGEKIRMFSNHDTGKIRRLEKDSRACLSVADPVGSKESWVTVEGTVELLEEGGKELALSRAKLYYDPGVYPDTERSSKNIAHWEQSDDFVLVVLTPTRIRSY